MIKSRSVWILLVAIGAFLMFLGGCASTEPSRFYILQSVSNAGLQSQDVMDRNGVAIGIGPVKIPDYLDRPQIVTRISHNELHLAEFDKWAEPLEDNFSRVFAENLSSELSTNRIFFFPWKRSTVIDYQITVEITRFDSEADGNSVLIARWRILGGDESKVLSSGKSRFSEPVDVNDYNAIVSAMSQNLANLSGKIAAEIKGGLEKTHN